MLKVNIENYLLNVNKYHFRFIVNVINYYYIMYTTSIYSSSIAIVSITIL